MCGGTNQYSLYFRIRKDLLIVFVGFFNAHGFSPGNGVVFYEGICNSLHTSILYIFGNAFSVYAPDTSYSNNSIVDYD